MRVVIVAEHASTQFGGEAFIPFNYFRMFLARQLDVHLVVHSRTAPELRRWFPNRADRLHFVDDTLLQIKLAHFGSYLPRRVSEVTLGFVSHMVTQLCQRRVVRDLVRRHNIDVVHEPIPVSPKLPSLIYDVGAPVVIGPLNGGMEFPRAFQAAGISTRLVIALGRRLANLVNALIPGKRRASILLVANTRTREALPRGTQGRVIEMVENGVDLSLWTRKTSRVLSKSTRFVFVGRLVDWKAVDMLLEAISRIRDCFSVSLEIIGEGPMRQAWEELADRLGISEIVRFAGWMSHEQCARRLEQADVFVLASVFESGGAVVLEAMAMGLPVIATAWGGPLDYLDDSCGILVTPNSRAALISGLASAMKVLAESDDLRRRMGSAARERVERLFDWERKIDAILQIYELAKGPNIKGCARGSDEQQ